MKINLPVTGQERLFSGDKILVSKTDNKGIITFVNRDFVEVSGFSEKELVGTNHNIIRHPDMPPATFEILWETVKHGLPWQGMVKNRCKNGDHYWVDAKVVPIKRSGIITGYMSVRTGPLRQAVEEAEKAIGKTAAATPKTTNPTIASWQKHLSIRNGIPVWIAFVALMMIIGGVLGITGLNLSNSAMQTLYDKEMDPVQVIGRINFLMADNRAQVALALHHSPATHPDVRHDHSLGDHMQTLVRNKEEIDRIWEPYVKKIDPSAERDLAEQYWQARNRFVQEGLLKAKAALDAGNFAQAESVLASDVTPLYGKANASVSVLLQHLSDRGRARFAEVSERNKSIAKAAIAGIVLSCLILVLAGIFFFRVTVMPLQKAVLALEDIAQGNLSGAVDSGGYGEPERVMAAVTTMQMHLKVMLHEIGQSSNSVREQCSNLNQTMMNLAEHSEEQHDRVYQLLDAVTVSGANLKALANEAKLLKGTADVEASGVFAATPINAADSGLEPMPSELLALFGESSRDTPQDSHAGDEPAASTDRSPLGSSFAAGAAQARRVHELANMAEIQAAAVDDAARQLNRIAGLIVENREEVQGAWLASQQLEKTAGEMDGLIEYFG